MELQNYTLMLTRIECLASSTESGHDDVYFKLYPNGDPSLEQVHLYNSALKMNARGDALRYVDLTIDATYLQSLRVCIWDKDVNRNADDKLGEMTITRDSALVGSEIVVQTTGDAQARYKLEWRVISKPIPTLRVLGIMCQHSSAGCDAEVIRAVAGVVADCADLASDAIGHVKTPRALAMSKAFGLVADTVELLAELEIFLANLCEGDDEVYLQHIDPGQADDAGGAFCPPDANNIKMNDGDQVSFLDTYGRYFRFPLDRGPVTIQIREGDRLGQDVCLGAITVGDAEYQALLGKGATVLVACDYLDAHNGEGAIYHLCYSVALEDWAKDATDVAQGEQYPPTGANWTTFTSLPPDLQITTAPALISRGAGKLTCFAGGTTAEGRSKLLQRSTEGGAWTGWVDLEREPRGAPAAVNWNGGEHIDLVICAPVSTIVRHRVSENGAWGEWEDEEGAILLSSGLALASWGVGRLDCFARGPNGDLQHRAFEGAWSPWGSLDGVIVGAPAAVSWGPRRVDVVARGTGPTSSLWHRCWNPSDGWTPWVDVGGGPIASSPSICSRGENRLDVFALSGTGSVIHRAYDSSGWSGWLDIGRGAISNEAPAAVATGAGRLDVVIRGLDGQLWTSSWSG